MVTTRSMSRTTEGADTRVAENVKKVKRPKSPTKGPGWTLKTITKKERALRNAYSRFVKEKFMPQFHEKCAKGLCGRNDIVNMSKVAGEEWDSMTDSEKAPYFAAVENELKIREVAKRPSKKTKRAEGGTANKEPGWALKTITKKERTLRNAYSRFVKEKFMPQFHEKRAKGLCRRIDVYNVCKDAGEQWASMTDSEKAPYFAAVENELKIREVPNREVPYRPSKKTKRAEVETANKGPGWTLKTITKKERPMREAYSRFVKEKFMPQFHEKRAKGLCRRIDVYNVCKDAGEQWASMTDSEKAPYFAAVDTNLAELKVKKA